MKANQVMNTDSMDPVYVVRIDESQFGDDICTNYHGHFSGFNNVTPQNFQSITELDLNVSAAVLIREANDGQDTSVFIENGTSQISVEQEDGRLIIRSTPSEQIDGAVLEKDSLSSHAAYKRSTIQQYPARVIIYANANTKLSATLKKALLVSATKHSEAILNTSGTNSVALAADNIRLDNEGDGNILASVANGSLSVNTAGRAAIEVFGEYNAINVTARGMAYVHLHGHAQGDVNIASEKTAIPNINDLQTTQGTITRENLETRREEFERVFG